MSDKYEINEYTEEKDDKKDKLNDIVITQCILCLVLAVGMLVLNVFYPDISSELIEKYRKFCKGSENQAFQEAVNLLDSFIR